MKRYFAAFLLSLACVAVPAHAVTTVITMDSGSQTMTNNAGAALSGGTTANGNGTVIQLGYFTGATAANNFSGTWVPLTGAGSANTAYNTTSIGDLNANGAGDGTFAFDNLVFDPAVAGQNQNLPGSTTIPLAIRFYNTTTTGAATEINTVSSDLWLWKTPAAPSPLPPTINISLDDAGLEWQNGPSSAFKTTAVPEPSRILLGMMGLAFVGLRRRRC